MKRISDVEDIRNHVKALSEPCGVFCPCGVELVRREKEAGQCGNCRARAAEEEMERRRAAAQAERDASLDDVLARAGMPPRYRTCTRDNWRGPWPDAVAAWAVKPDLAQRDSLLIHGGAGTGKSHLAAVLLRDHLRPLGAEGLWWNAALLLDVLRREFGRDTDGAAMQAAIETPFLVLDDVGAETLAGDKGEWRRDRIGFLIQQRYDRLKATVITSNLELEDFMAEPRLGSRLLAGATCRRVGRDRRLA